MSNDNDLHKGFDDKDLGDLYRSASNDEPGAALDAAILAQAEEAVAPKRKRPAWIAPVGLAATVLLGVNLAVNLKDYSPEPDILMDAPRPVAETSRSRTPGTPADMSERAQTRRSSDAREEEVRFPASGVTLGNSDTSPGVLTDQPTISSDSISSGYAIPREAPDPIDSTFTLEPGTNIAGYESDSDRSSAEIRDVDNVRQHDVSPMTEQLLSATRAEQEAPVTPAAAPSPVESDRSEDDSSGSPPGFNQNAPVVVSESRAPLSDEVPKPQSAPESLAAAPPAAPAIKEDEQISDPEQVLITETSDSELEEVVVTGNSMVEIDTSPHRRLMAKDQAKRNERRRQDSERTTALDEAAPAAVSAAPKVTVSAYPCNLSVLDIDAEAIERAKINARTVEPPLNALTWQTYIRELASKGDYVAACTQLAAYRQLFPDLVMIEPLPVTILGDN